MVGAGFDFKHPPSPNGGGETDWLHPRMTRMRAEISGGKARSTGRPGPVELEIQEAQGRPESTDPGHMRRQWLTSPKSAIFFPVDKRKDSRSKPVDGPLGL